jgi:hypothetical protein
MELENLTKVNRNSRRALMATVILIAGAAMYNWTVAPHTNNILAAQQYIDTLDDVDEKRESLQKITSLKKKKLKELHDQMGELRGLFFSHQEATEFFSDLQAVSIEENCRPVSIVKDPKRTGSKSEQKQDSYIQTRTAEMVVTGSYGEVVSLITRLLTRPQKVSINSLEMEAFEEDFTKVKCMMILMIHTLQGEEASLDE